MVKVWGTTMVKNEIDMIAYSIGNMFRIGVDGVIVADNMSDDGTSEKLESLKSIYPTLVVVQDTEVGYYQSRKMTNLGHLAASRGAEWIIPFDADELPYSRDGRLADLLRTCEGDVVNMVVWHMVATEDYNLTPLSNIVMRRPNPEPFPNIIYRYHPDAVVHQGNHGINHPGVGSTFVAECKHYQYRSYEQFAKKVRQGKIAYDATDLPYGEGQHWREMGAMSDEDLRNLWNSMKFEEGLVYDPYDYI